MRYACMLLVLLISLMPAYAVEDKHMYLLAVSEEAEGYSGSIADLYIEIIPGRGRVFIDTFPLSKIDTQISTRFAKEFACDYLDMKCSRYDFIYTIRSNSALIGGPSAGAAITFLTIAALEEMNVDETISLTGTINSGGLIGNVGGIKQKIIAAKENGLTKVLIPSTEQYALEDNVSIDLVKLGEEIGIKVVPVSDINEVIFEFTGTVRRRLVKELNIDDSYATVMDDLADILCTRSKDIAEDTFPLLSHLAFNDTLQTQYRIGLNMTLDGENAIEEGLSYSAASYCFGANVQHRFVNFLAQDMSPKDITVMIENTRKEIKDIDVDIDSTEINTITDLEAFMIVKERIRESEEYMDSALQALLKNQTNASKYNLAFGIERLYSARSWSTFFGDEGQRYNLDHDMLEKTCITKLSEAQERFEYVQQFFPGLLPKTDKLIDSAFDEMKDGNMQLCIFRAAKAKSESDVFLSMIGVTQEQIDSVIQTKIDAAKQVIAEQIAEDNFPILGYSYYQYANSLREDDPISSILYIEYALELSRLDMYFNDDGNYITVDYEKLVVLMIGIFSGLIGGILLARRR